ncbi:MAG: hypothetical protein AB7Q16_15410 [Vicinamibacterales bacterium]
MRPSSEAAALISEARDVGGRTLALSPGCTQVRKQMAMAEEGLARAALSRPRARGLEPPRGPRAPEAVPLLKQSGATEVASRSVGDATVTRELARVEGRLAGLEASDIGRKGAR